MRVSYFDADASSRTEYLSDLLVRSTRMRGAMFRKNLVILARISLKSAH